MSNIRHAAVAGTFYPANPADLKEDVDRMLANAATDAPCPKAIISPHAGYIYSGPIAASVYARVRNGADTITRVVLLGPSHRVGFKGIAATNADYYRTPLGDIPIDTEAVRLITGLAATGYLDEAHSQEHSLEVQLPFLQQCLADFKLVPLVVGDASPDEVGAVIDRLWGGPETLLVISSDMSHYQSYITANELDKSTADHIVNLRPDVRGEQACGCRPINGLLRVAAQRNLKVELIDLRNSGDTAGSHDRVVGYAAFLIYEDSPGLPAGNRFSLANRQILLQQARNAIETHLRRTPAGGLETAGLPPLLQERGASFVTINLNGRLRGCIGSLEAHRPLAEDVIHNAMAAAFQDPRFTPLTLQEYPGIELHISVLSKPVPLAVSSRQDLLVKLRPGIDGLIIEEAGRRATFLPSVWEQLPDPEQFVTQLRLKAGLPGAAWNATTRVQHYQTEEFA